MQQRQPRLGDTVDDYCPRERRVTNHVVVAMIGQDVKQTRCATCDADHEYKHARLPRPRKKNEPAALYSQVLAAVVPKKVAHAHEPEAESELDSVESATETPEPGMSPERFSESAPMTARSSDHAVAPAGPAGPAGNEANGHDEHDESDADDTPQDELPEGPLHRRLIRAQLPRIEGQPPAPRQTPDFTIRQPGGGGGGGRPGRFRPRGPRPGQSFQGGGQGGNSFRQGPPRGNGGGNGGQRQQPGRSPISSHTPRRQGAGGGKRSK